MSQPTAELFEALVDQNLTVITASGNENWRITSVSRRESHGLRSDQPFTIYLLAPANNNRQQGMRASTLPNGESFEFFGVPISASADGVAYEVIFN